ncbi:MAG: polysulfide reductase NrfD [Nitrososphaerota archaeon]|nr:polysulfide reductase NrfD [Nitrososphaerota archaeon]
MSIAFYPADWTWHIWGMLFFIGMGAGASLFAGTAYVLSRKKFEVLMNAGTYLSFPIGLVGAILLITHVTKPFQAYLVFRNSGSVMTWGAAFISAFLIVSLIDILVTRFRPDGNFKLGTKIVTMIVAFLVATYSAVLLGALASRPLWFTPFLPWLFLSSALLTGVALTMGTSSLSVRGRQELSSNAKTLGRSLIVLEASEALFIGLYAISVSPSGELMNLLQGSLGLYFLLGVVVVGLAVPLLADIYMAVTKAHFNYALSGISAILVLVGGLLLRYVIVMAGQMIQVLH